MDWNLVQSHLARYGSVKYTSLVLGLSERSLRRKIHTGVIQYPENWDEIKIKHANKQHMLAAFNRNPNHKATGVRPKIERLICMGEKSNKRIADQVGCSNVNVWHTRRQLTKLIDHSLVKTRIDKQTARQIQRLLDRSYTLNQVSEIMDIHQNTLREMRNRGEISYVNRLDWDVLTDEQFFIKGPQRDLPDPHRYFNGRIPKNEVIKRRLKKHKLVPWVCAVTGRRPDKRRKHTQLILYRFNGDSTDNRLSNLCLISREHHPNSPPPRGYLHQDWSKVQQFYDQNTKKATQEEFGLSHRAIQKAIENGLLKDRSSGSVHECVWASLDWNTIQTQYDAGLSVVELMATVGISRNVINWAKSNNKFTARGHGVSKYAGR